MSSMLTEPTKTWRCFQSVVSRILIRQQQPRTSQTWYWLHMWWCSWLCCCSCCWLSSSALCLSWHPSKTLFLCLCFSFFASVLVPLPLFRFLCFCFGSFAMRKSFVWQSNFPMVEAGLQRNGVTERKKSKCCKPTEDPTLFSACACDSRKLKDYRETDLFSILTDSYGATWQFESQQKTWQICFKFLIWHFHLAKQNIDESFWVWMGPSKVVTSQWWSRSIMVCWVTHTIVVVRTLGSEPNVKNLFLINFSSNFWSWIWSSSVRQPL